jgi:hypothetical protein
MLINLKVNAYTSQVASVAESQVFLGHQRSAALGNKVRTDCLE